MPGRPDSSPGRGRVRTLARRFWKQAVALGVVAAVVGYVVPVALDEGSERIAGALDRDAPIAAQVLQPGEYQTGTFFTPMYIVGDVPPEAAPADLLADGRDDEYYAWAREHDAVVGQEQTFRLVLRGRDERPVIVNGITATVVERLAPAAGWFTHRRGCGAVEVREARIDLDRDPPGIAFSDNIAEPPTTPRLDFTKRVTPDDVEVVDVVATTRSPTLVRWRLEVLYSAADGTGSVVVDDRGEPFEVSGLARGRAEFYRLSDGVLVREPGSDPGEDGLVFC
ncbi:hypothetical protein [Miltoncostaea marina]|uniref:hypothetical protein n=1 Tax=Miltoncostaea marina TaxID=2843215 RepID=UPI001C3C860E|nr:hypothetical protein [Miltoncostaea marina]